MLDVCLHWQMPEPLIPGCRRVPVTGLMTVFLGLRVLEKALEKKEAKDKRTTTASPAEGLPSAATLVRSLRYAQVPVFILVVAPTLFKKLGI